MAKGCRPSSAPVSSQAVPHHGVQRPRTTATRLALVRSPPAGTRGTCEKRAGDQWDERFHGAYLNRCVKKTGKLHSQPGTGEPDPAKMLKKNRSGAQISVDPPASHVGENGTLKWKKTRPGKPERASYERRCRVPRSTTFTLAHAEVIVRSGKSGSLLRGNSQGAAGLSRLVVAGPLVMVTAQRG